MTGPDSGGRDHRRLDWRQVWILYARELRAALREKAVVINSILIPIFLYPFILWAAFSGLMFVQGQTEGFVSRVRVRGWPTGHATLRGKLERDKQIQLLESSSVNDHADREIKEGKLDALVEFLPADTTGAALAGNFSVRITFSESKERSATARQRVAAVIDHYREDWLKREAQARGIDPAGWQQFSIATRNVATGKQMGSFVLGMVLPFLFVVMVAMGCFYPAVDATAGERERNTWETLMSTAANRVSIVTSKYLYVATLGGVAGILNLTAMIVTIKPVFAPLLERAGDMFKFSVPVAAVPILVLAALLLAGFAAAGMMIFAAFARTFKEGQAMITPFYMVILLPVLFVQSPGLKFSLPLAFVPVVNVAMMVRSAVSGALPWLPTAMTIVVCIVLIAACIRIAAFILRFEDVMVGSYGGSLFKFIRHRALGRGQAGRGAGEATI